MSIASIQYKYPSAIWFDSNHGGTNLGTLDNPYTSLSTAFNAITSNANVIAILNGTHTGTINTPSTLGGGAADTLTLVGESTSAVLSGVLNKAAGYDLKLETLKFYNAGSGTYAISLDSNTSTFEGCILDNNRASASINTTQRGFFRGSGTSIITFRRNIFSVWAGNAQYYGSILGGSAGQGFAQVTFESNTIVTQGTDQLISHYNNPSSIVFKNNIISGSGIEYIRYGNASTVSETISNNCYFNTATTTANARDTGGAIFADPQFVDPANNNYRLRPSSPAIGSIQTFSQQAGAVYISPNGAGDNSGNSEANAVNWNSGSGLGTAENLAGANGTIYFLDGSYPFGSSQTFAGASGLTYEALNLHQAVLGDTGTARFLGIGSTTIDGIKINKFKLTDINTIYSYGTGANDNSMDSCLHISSVYKDCESSEYFYGASGSIKVTNSCFSPKITGSGFRVFSNNNHYTFNNCVFNFGTDGTLTTKIGWMGTSPNADWFKNTIFACDNDANVKTDNKGNFAQFATNCSFFQMGSANTSGGTNNLFNVDPKFIDSNLGDFRLRPDSRLIGGISKSLYGPDTIWVQPGSGTAGTGTEDNAFYWSQYSDAFLAATQSSSKQLIFKDGTYIWTSAILQDDNVGNNIIMVAENMHQAIFTDGFLRINSAGNYPTLRFKGIKLLAQDHFTHVPECHYVFDSVHLLCNKQIGALSVTATGSIFEVATGKNTSIFNNSGPVNIRNCIFTDHNDRPPSEAYLTDANSGTIKNTIFYTKYPRADCIRPGHNAVLTSCASENITNQKSGIEYFNNLGFIDIENKNYNLRPKSPLIGQGE